MEEIPVVVALTLVFLMLGGALVLTPVTGGSEATAWVIVCTGEVEVYRQSEDSWQQVSELPEPLYEQDMVRTGPESGASLEFANGTQVIMHELTAVKIASPEERADGLWRRLQIFLGEIFVKVDRTDRQMDFETPNVVASVRGTTFGASVSADQLGHLDVIPHFEHWRASDVFTTEVATRSGRVYVANELGGVEVSEGQRVRVRHRERPGSPERIEVSGSGPPQWVQRIQRGVVTEDVESQSSVDGGEPPDAVQGEKLPSQSRGAK